MNRRTLDVRFEDEWLLIVDKPPGLLSHPISAGEDSLAGRARAYLGGVKVHLVHRLDRDTSGLVIVAKSPRVQHRLQGQRRAGVLRPTYLALVKGNPAADAAVIDAPIGRNPDDPPLRAVCPDGQAARTYFEVVERYPSAAMLRLTLETGRTHQIRVHLEYAGFPIVGDPWYGRSGMDLIGRQALHASAIACLHPITRDPLVVEAPPPPDMEGLQRVLRDRRL